MSEKEIACKSCSIDLSEIEEKIEKRKKIAIIIISGMLLLFGLLFEFIINVHFIAQSIFLVVAILSGYSIGKHGLQALFKKRLNIDFLITIAAIGAFLIGHGEEGAAVVFLYYIAEFLEDYAAERARRSVTELMELAPEIAIVKKDGKEIEMPIDSVNVGDITIVKPGERIPLDGYVISGAASINQSLITGESMPITKSVGDTVFAGTMNEDGYLEVKVVKRSTESTIAKIAKLVEEAQKKKSQTEVFIDKFARYYTPLVISVAFLIAVIPPFVFGQPFYDWLYKSLVLLVISCPCALAISTPVSMVSGITSAAKNGVLIKGGNYIEEIKNIKTFVFDKTGTLTEGKPEVVDVIPLNNYSKEELLQIAASVETKSKHPLAEAIVEHARKKSILLVDVPTFKSVTGKGILGTINNKQYYIGSKAFFNDLDIKIPVDIVEKIENDGNTVVLIGNDKHVVGVLALRDRIRDEAHNAIKNLKRDKIKTIMLTGDNIRTAKAIATKLGVDEYYAELLPEDKVEIIEQLSRKYESVAMVGDGVNDAPALAKANVGISLGAAGSDIAIETADIVLMNDDLLKINYLRKLSRKTMSIVKQNVAASILIKGSFAILTFPGLITLWLAVAIGDMGLSLAVILNALRIAKK